MHQSQYCYVLAGLHIPESYLTALVQATCRKNGWPLDRSTLYTQVTQWQSAEEVTERSHQGKQQYSYVYFSLISLSLLLSLLLSLYCSLYIVLFITLFISLFILVSLILSLFLSLYYSL